MRKASPQLCFLSSVAPLPGSRGTCLSHLSSVLVQHNYMELSLRTIWKQQLIQNLETLAFQYCTSMLHVCYGNCTGSQCVAKWNSRCWLLPLKAFHITGLRYLWDHFSLVVFIHPTRSDRRGMVWIPSIKECHLRKPWKPAFSLQHLSFGTPYHPQDQIGLDSAGLPLSTLCAPGQGSRWVPHFVLSSWVHLLWPSLVFYFTSNCFYCFNVLLAAQNYLY